MQITREGGNNMPIYIVRWSNPKPSICLVKAKSEAQVLAIMDEIADPSYCRVQKYDGPICISLDLKLKYHDEEIKVSDNITEHHTVVDDIGECLDEIPLDVWVEGNTDVGFDMKEAIIQAAFPNYSSYWEKLWERENPTPEDADKCKKAIQQDFDDIEKDIRASLCPQTDTDLPPEIRAS